MTGGFSISLIIQVLTPISDSKFLLIKYNKVDLSLLSSSVVSAKSSLVNGISEKFEGICVLGMSHLWVKRGH